MFGSGRIGDERTVVQDYWYTTTHVEDLGEVWQRNGQEVGKNNLFVSCGEEVGRTGFDAEHLDSIPEGEESKILLPLNKGGYHWTAITVKITYDDEGRRQVKIDFTDSLSRAKKFEELPEAIQEEMVRIGSFFEGSVNYGVYPHTWRQPDGSSCGPYSFANGVRCLDGVGAQLNPGREGVRAEQLDMMTNPTGIRSCSTNNQIDDILRDWVIKQISDGKSYSIANEAEFNKMCEGHAADIQADPKDVRQIFLDEYDPGATKPILRLYRVQQRLGELIASDATLIAALEDQDKFDEVAVMHEKMRHNNCMEQIEIIRKQFATDKKFSSRTSYLVTARIIEHLSKMNQEEALKEILELKDETKIAKCIEAVTNILSSRAMEEDYSKKLSALAEAYHDIYQAKTKLRDEERKHSANITHLEASADEITSINPITANQQTLDKTIRLLECGIRRNNANLVQSVGYFFKDCLAYITSAVTIGWWQPDKRLISRIAQTVGADKFNDELSRIEEFLSIKSAVQASKGKVLANKQKVEKRISRAKEIAKRFSPTPTPTQKADRTKTSSRGLRER